LILHWTEIGQHIDLQVYVEGEYAPISQHESKFKVMARSSPSGLTLRQGFVRWWEGNPGVEFSLWNNGTYHRLKSEGGLPSNHAAHERTSLLLELEGPTGRVKAWSTGQNEPNWQFTHSTTSGAMGPGYVGVGAWKDGTYRIYQIGVGIAGDPAPRSAD
jgi:hypothetical protein